MPTTITVTSGQVATLKTLNDGDLMKVSSGGEAFETVVNSGGLQVVFAGGVASSPNLTREAH
jgi:autotransporter passenger strand-loop-strand repeat protein